MSLKDWMRYLEEQEKVARGQLEKESKEEQVEQHLPQPIARSRFSSPPWGRTAPLGQVGLQRFPPVAAHSQPEQPKQVQDVKGQAGEVPKLTSEQGPPSQLAQQRRSIWIGIKTPRSQNRLDRLLKQILLQVAQLQQELSKHADENPRWKLLKRLLDPDMSIRDVALLLDVCETTVRRYTNSGLLEHYRTSGNQRRFRLSHVLNFLTRFSAEETSAE